MKLLKEFKEFAVKGNMIDMAVGIIIGMSFNNIIDILAKQIILPPLTYFTNGVNINEYKIILKESVMNQQGDIVAEEVAIAYGALLEAIFDFIIIGFCVFLLVKFMNKLRNRAQDINDNSVETPKDIQLLAELKELMMEQNKLLQSKK